MDQGWPETQDRRFAALLAPWNGQRLNTAAIARCVRVSRPTAVERLRKAEEAGLVRVLPYLGVSHRPRLYLCDGFDFRGFCIDAVAARMLKIAPESRFFWWKTGRVRQIDLVVDTGRARVGFCIAASTLRYNRYWLPLRRALRCGVIQRGFSLHNGEWGYFAAPEIYSLPLSAFLKDVECWVSRSLTEWQARRAIGLINRH